MALILVIDDDPPMRAVVRRVLQSCGHEVIEAADGEIGIRLMLERRPNLVITDIVMPNKEGLETIIAARRVCPDMKIVAMSGIGGTRAHEYLSWARKLGADASLTKPFHIGDFRAAITELLAEAA